MNLDDESLLSAYLDGELDPRSRRALERELTADPHLADRLCSLGGVRDLVAALPRPPIPADISRSVESQIRQRLGAPPDRSARRASRRRAIWGAAAASAAAILALVLGLSTSRPGGQPNEHPGGPPPVVASATGPAVGPRFAPRPGAPKEGGAPSLRLASSAASAPAAGAESAAREAERRRLLGMLDSPDLRTVLVVTDVFGGKAAERVDSLVRSTPRVDAAFGQITVTQGIFIDPKHPDEATVYALVMDDRELRQLRETLGREFPGALEETSPDPAVLAQLAEIDRATLRPGIAVADVIIPSDGPVRSARREATTPDLIARAVIEGGNSGTRVFAEPERASPPERDQPTAEQEASGPSPARPASASDRDRGSHPAAPTPGKDGPAAETIAIAGLPDKGLQTIEIGRPEGASRPQVVLVWVTSAGRRGGRSVR